MRIVNGPRPLVNGPGTAAAPLIGLETYDPSAAIELLQSLREGDADEQRATLEYLMQALDEGRSEGLKIFPEK
jgi:hypothetical protein